MKIDDFKIRSDELKFKLNEFQKNKPEGKIIDYK